MIACSLIKRTTSQNFHRCLISRLDHVSACRRSSQVVRYNGYASAVAKKNTSDDDNDNINSPATLSRRKQFQQIPVDPKLLQYIRDQQVCKPMRQARTRKVDRFIGAATQSPRHLINTRSHNAARPKRPPPPPFGPHANPVRVRHRIKAADTDISEKLYKLNPQRIPTVAMCGRSNVGKSTLLNALLYGNRSNHSQKGEDDKEEAKKPKRRKNNAIPMPKGAKATMSSKPGETKDITFYELSASSPPSSSSPPPSSSDKEDGANKKPSHVLWLADLPGYGFAHASPEMATAYRELMATYICHKRRPQRVLLLLDARHGMKQTDRAFLYDLQSRDYQLPPLQIVLTKCDLVDATDLARRVKQVQDDLDDVLRRQTSRLPVLLTSATRHNGILAVQKELASLVRK